MVKKPEELVWIKTDSTSHYDFLEGTIILVYVEHRGHQEYSSVRISNYNTRYSYSETGMKFPYTWKEIKSFCVISGKTLGIYEKLV